MPVLQRRRVTPGFGQIHPCHLGAVREAGQRGGGEVPGGVLAGRRPVRQQAANVGQRVAQGGQLPVQDGDHLPGLV